MNFQPILNVYIRAECNILLKNFFCICTDACETNAIIIWKQLVLPDCFNVNFFPEAPSFHRQQRWYGTGPCSCSASAWVAKGWELVPESHQQNLPTRKLPVWEFFQLCHKYPFSNQECLSYLKLCAGVLKKLLDSFSSYSLHGSYSVSISILQVSCSRWQCTMDYQYASCHLFWHLEVPLITTPSQLYSENQQQLGLLVQMVSVSSVRYIEGIMLQGC